MNKQTCSYLSSAHSEIGSSESSSLGVDLVMPKIPPVAVLVAFRMSELTTFLRPRSTATRRLSLRLDRVLRILNHLRALRALADTPKSPNVALVAVPGLLAAHVPVAEFRDGKSLAVERGRRDTTGVHLGDAKLRRGSQVGEVQLTLPSAVSMSLISSRIWVNDGVLPLLRSWKGVSEDQSMMTRYQSPAGCTRV